MLLTSNRTNPTQLWPVSVLPLWYICKLAISVYPICRSPKSSTFIYVLFILCALKSNHLCPIQPMYVLFCTFCFHRTNWHSSATLTEVSPCFFLSCKANTRVKLAKTWHGPHNSQINCVVLSIVCVLCIICVQICAVLLPRVVNSITVKNISIYNKIYSYSVDETWESWTNMKVLCCPLLPW
jgi:hypothetical protein